MELSEYKNIFDHEETHFFYEANHRLLISLIKKYVPGRSDLKILDAGCGTGLLLTKLQQFGQAEGVDISPEALKFCRKRKVKATLASLTKLPFKANTFDLVVSVDVLYHLQVSNDVKALQELYRVLKPGGILIVRLPANKWLKLMHDTHVHTRERYTVAELQEKLYKAQFAILKVTYVNAVFLLLALIKYFLERFSDTSDVSSGVSSMPSFINSLLIKVADVELWWLQSHSLPFGLGVMAVAQKKEK